MAKSETPSGRELDQLLQRGAIPRGKRIQTYLPTSKEVCPRCDGEGFIEVKSDSGQSVRQCTNCGKCYLP